MGAITSAVPAFFQCTEVQVGIVTFLVSVFVYKGWKKLSSNDRPKPPGPWGFPILGHLPILGNEPNITFMKIGEKFGNIFMIRMGIWDTVVVNGKDAIMEALVKMEEDFAGRPMFESSKMFADGKSLGFGDYDDLYKVHRKLVARLLTEFSSVRKNPIEDMVHEEVDVMIKEFLSHAGSAFNPRESIYVSIASIIYQICYGHHSDMRENDDFSKFLSNSDEFSKFVNAANPVDVIPWLKYVMPWKMRKFASLIATSNHLRDKKVEEHRQKFSRNEISDLTDGLLATLHDGTPISDERIWSTIDALFGAGFETVASTFHWILLLLAAYPEVQKRVHEELDDVVGSSKRPCIQDRDKLVFTEAVLHEVNRFVSLLPLGLPHSATKDTDLCGYSIKKGTVVFINLYSMGHDKKVWGDPEVFRPERFLDDSGQINKSLLDEFLTFSAGRRKCLGESLARSEIFLFFTGLLQRCSIVKPPEVKEYKMEIKFGLTRQSMPYAIQVKPRY